MKCDYCLTGTVENFSPMYLMLSDFRIICEDCFNVIFENNKENIRKIDEILLSGLNIQEDEIGIIEKQDIFFIYYKTKKGGL